LGAGLEGCWATATQAEASITIMTNKRLIQ
jgi:hypothetical protein